MKEKTDFPFHQGELAVQKRLKILDSQTKQNAAFIRQIMPQQHRDFFTQLPWVILGLTDNDGFPWAIPFQGQKGFISSPNERRLEFNLYPQLIKELNINFYNRQKVGMLGIQIETRRRNRMNGVLDAITEQSFAINVEQSFGNCPRYIQKREWHWVEPAYKEKEPLPVIFSTQLDKNVSAQLKAANTFFIASRTASFDENSSSGIDVSHRGGLSGFIQVEGNKLIFPDFSGNQFFNTLGNIELDKRVGLFFPDHHTGNALFLLGHASILWDSRASAQCQGAERIIEVDIENIAYVSSLLAIREKSIEYSTALEATGIWAD